MVYFLLLFFQLFFSPIKTHTAICRDIAAREKRLRKGLTDEELEAFFRIAEKLKKNMENAE